MPAKYFIERPKATAYTQYNGSNAAEIASFVQQFSLFGTLVWSGVDNGDGTATMTASIEGSDQEPGPVTLTAGDWVPVTDMFHTPDALFTALNQEVLTGSGLSFGVAQETTP